MQRDALIPYVLITAVLLAVQLKHLFSAAQLLPHTALGHFITERPFAQA